MWWRDQRTTGIMQVASKTPLSDIESIERGIKILQESWISHGEEDEDGDGQWQRVNATIADYNRDNDYVSRVVEIMEILAKRIDPDFKSAYQRIYKE